MSNELLTVIGFDPGESTGYVVLGIKAGDLMQPSSALHLCVTTLAAGTINCHDAAGQFLSAHKHAGLNMLGENTGISQMLDIATTFPTAAIVVEDFIPDFKKMDQAPTHTFPRPSDGGVLIWPVVHFYRRWPSWRRAHVRTEPLSRKNNLY